MNKPGLGRIASSVEMVMQRNPDANPSKIAALFEEKIKAEEAKKKADAMGLEQEVARQEVTEKVINSQVQKEIDGEGAAEVNEIIPENLYETVGLEPQTETQADPDVMLSESVGLPVEVSGVSGKLVEVEGDYYVSNEKGYTPISEGDAATESIGLTVKPPMEYTINEDDSITIPSEGDTPFTVSDVRYQEDTTKVTLKNQEGKKLSLTIQG
jgi:hypothetical protein